MPQDVNINAGPLLDRLAHSFCHKLPLTDFFRLRFDQPNFFPAEIRLEEFSANFRLNVTVEVIQCYLSQDQ